MARAHSRQFITIASTGLEKPNNSSDRDIKNEKYW